MRDKVPDTVTPGGRSAPLGARGTAGASGADPRGAAAGRGATHGLPLTDSLRTLGAIFVLSLLAYAALAADVVHGGRLTDADHDLSNWIARSMPAWAEWTARVLSVVGGFIGVTLVLVPVVVWLLRRRERAAAVLLVAVAVGSQLLTTASKNGYDRARPTAGSPIDLPSSSSFPSGHALTGLAVFGVLGILLARELTARGARGATIAVGFCVGALIGASRVVLDVHFLTDVLAGAALGLAWLATCLLAARLVGAARRRYSDQP